LTALLSGDAEMVILVKPQFELERHQVGKGGIIRDPELHAAACKRVAAAVERLGFRSEIIPSPILGAEGNREFLLYARH
jgi:23S rRNA (cytidine1920-2'-O)/16S rRNA (cytidine1409-2'-O)-methyltransferase